MTKRNRDLEQRRPSPSPPGAVTWNTADDRTPAANGELAAAAFVVRRCEA
jgi:hypothetical protein